VAQEYFLVQGTLATSLAIPAAEVNFWNTGAE